jgi:hypothetical protein
LEIVAWAQACTNPARQRTNNLRVSALVRSEKKDNRSTNDTKNAEEGVDAAVKRRGVGIGFGRHG